MNNTTALAERINSFNFYYEMSDDNGKWLIANREEEEIIAELSTLSTEELREVKASFTADEGEINRYFSEFFANLPEPTPEPVKETKVKSTHSRVFIAAWAMFKEELFKTFGEALTQLGSIGAGVLTG